MLHPGALPSNEGRAPGRRHAIGRHLMIDRLVASIPGAERGIRLLFSTTPFPGRTIKLE